MFIGVEIKIRVVSCECEPLALTLARAQLWPASPTYPRYAFSFSLLDWAESLLREFQVALKDFCHTLYFRCPFKILSMDPLQLIATSIIIINRYRIYMLLLLMLLRSTGMCCHPCTCNSTLVICDRVRGNQPYVGKPTFPVFA